MTVMHVTQGLRQIVADGGVWVSQLSCYLCLCIGQLLMAKAA